MATCFKWWIGYKSPFKKHFLRDELMRVRPPLKKIMKKLMNISFKYYPHQFIPKLTIFFASFGMWLLFRSFANLRCSYSMEHLLSSLLLVALPGCFGFEVSGRQLSAERGARWRAPDQLCLCLSEHGSTFLQLTKESKSSVLTLPGPMYQLRKLIINEGAKKISFKFLSPWTF